MVEKAAPRLVPKLGNAFMHPSLRKKGTTHRKFPAVATFAFATFGGCVFSVFCFFYFLGGVRDTPQAVTALLACDLGCFLRRCVSVWGVKFLGGWCVTKAKS